MAIQMLLLPLLAEIGWVELSGAPFHPLGAVMGGYGFGIAMSWAAGCAGGVWYKSGAGNWRMAIAILGLAIGATSTEIGGLRSVRRIVQGVGASEALRSATVGDLIHSHWILYLLAPLLLLGLWRSKVTSPAPTAWTWLRTGAAMGLLASLAWLSSMLVDRTFGMAVIPGSVAVLQAIVGEGSLLSWDLFFVLFIPAGGWLASRGSTPASSELKRKDAAKLFVGGAALGVTASLAGGCTVGHSLVGLPLLSLGSIVTTVFIILGSWTVGWFEMRAAGSKG